VDDSLHAWDDPIARQPRPHPLVNGLHLSVLHAAKAACLSDRDVDLKG
jgi:hypothetical protein